MTHRTSTAARAYADWQAQQPRRKTPQDYAREAAQNAPSPAAIKRVTAAYLGQDAALLGKHEMRGWIVRLYRTHIVRPGQNAPPPDGVYVCAERIAAKDVPDGVPECLSEDCADLDAAREWCRGLPA